MSTEESEKKLIQKILRYPLKDHPFMPNPSEDERLRMIENIGAQEVFKMFVLRENRVRAEEMDPFRYGIELEGWPAADDMLNRYPEALVSGGNRSGKSNYAAKRAAQLFVGQGITGKEPDWVKERIDKRGLNIWCFHTNTMTSIAMQQSIFYNYLPQELKETKRNNQTQISYTQKNGFSDNTAVYMKNQVWFLNYEQKIDIVEGGECDFVWCDELIPANWLETIRYRLITRKIGRAHV